jgi:pimeloyl-ACP methyl ester carboxylesterase
MLRAARFLHGYLRQPAGGILEEELSIDVDGAANPCTLYRSRRGRPQAGWVILHGMTVPGREHPSLTRFARALAASGGVVLVPEIASWRELRVDPAAADRVIVRAAEYLASRPEVRPGGVGIVGFSFGATQALVTAARPELRDSIRAVVGFGGYCDPHATFLYSFTGEHEWNGVRSTLEPDPYGRWIVTANYLTQVPEYAGMVRVAAGVHALAVEAGVRRTFAGDPSFDPIKAALRDGLTAEECALWDIVAAPTGQAVPREAARALGERIAAAALARHPSLDPRPALPAIRCATVLAHGYSDQLIPYAETLHLHQEISAHSRSYLSISRLFAHSQEAPRLRLREYPREALRYVRLLDRALSPR